MLARLQRRLVLGTVLAVLLWVLSFASAGRWGWALAGLVLGLTGHALVLGWEFVCVALVHGDDPAPRARAAQLLRAWWGEVLVAPQVFAWRQPFRAQAWPDADGPAPGRRGIVFVHGFVCNRAFWNPWFEKLQPLGVPYASVNLEPVFGAIDDYPPQVEEAVRRMELATGVPPLVVCHSMGGLAVRAWLRWQAAAGSSDQRVHHVLTLGTPHHGTWLARWAFSHNGRQMAPANAWLKELASSERPERSQRFTCLYSHCDNIVFPASTAVLNGARAQHIEGVAHVEMAFVPQAWQAAMDLLAQEAPASRVKAAAAQPA